MRVWAWFSWLFGLVLLSGCRGEAISVTLLPTLTPRPTMTATATWTPVPPTSTPTPTATITSTPTATATAMAFAPRARTTATVPLPRLEPESLSGAGSGWQVASLTAIDGQATWALLAEPATEAWRLMIGDVDQPFQRDVTPPSTWRQTRRLPAWLPVDTQRMFLYLGGATVAVTQNRGQTWHVELLPMPPEAEGLMPDWGIWAKDASTGRVALLVSLEGGMQHDYAALFVREPSGVWHLAFSPYENPDSPLNLFASTGLAMYGRTLWVTKENGAAAGAVWVASHDLGRTWQSHVIQIEDTGDAPCPTSAPQLWNEAQGILVATCFDWTTAQPHAYLLRWVSGQVRWQPLPEGATNVRFWRVDQGYAWRAAGDAGITARLWLTDDGGLSWQERSLPPDADEVELAPNGVGFAWPALEPDGLGMYWVTRDGWRTYESRAVRLPEGR